MDRDETKLNGNHLRAANDHGRIESHRAGYVRIVHPVTQRFIAEFDPERGLLRVSDGGKTATIDLNGIRIAL